MKKIIPFLLASIMLVGCTKTTAMTKGDETKSVPTNATAINVEPTHTPEIVEIHYEAEFSYDLSNAKQTYDNAQYMAIITIDSVDGALGHSRFNEDVWRFPYTYGKFTVVQSIKGDIPQGQFEFERVGGVVTWSEYLRGMPKAAREKLLRLRDKNVAPPEYVSWYLHDVIAEIEPGKTYLAVLADNSENVDGVYYLTGGGGGLRELVEVGSERGEDGLPVYTVLNNFTGEYEPMSTALGE